MATIGLHVFMQSTGVIRAYERLGFHTTSLNMVKRISA
jgi:hypothetical protein